MCRSWALVQQYVHSRNTYPWRHYKNVNERRRGGREENQLSTRAHAGLATRGGRRGGRGLQVACAMAHACLPFLRRHNMWEAPHRKNLSSMNDSTREGGRVQARLRRRNRLCMQHQHEEPICLHLFEQFHKNRGTIQHMDFTLGSGSLTGKGQNIGVLRFAHPVVCL